MSDTSTAVDTAITEAFETTPTETSAPPIVRRDEVRERIRNVEWKDEAQLVAERSPKAEGDDAPADGSTPAITSETTSTPTAEHDDQSTTSDDASPTAATEPPPEAIIGEGGTRIVVRSPDGKYATAPSVKLEFQVGDKTYLKTPAELVRMARDGVAGQAVRDEVKQYREQVPVIRQQYDAMQSELEAQRALNLELLSDESRYLARKEEWDRLNAPEERLRRLEAERAQDFQQRRAQQEQAQRQQVVMTYYAQEVKPVQDEVLTKHPEVSLEAKMGRIALDTAQLLVNGIVPPERLPEYKAYLDGPFREWLTTEAAKYQQAATQQQTIIANERRKAQSVVQSVGRQTAPSGRAAPDAPPAAPKPRNREEAKRLIIQRAWQD